IDDSLKLSYIFRERLVFFFHTHFTTKRSVVGNSRSLYYQQALFRLYAFDSEDIIIPPEDPEDPESMETVVPRNLREFTKKLSVDNAMLVFLDGRFNVKGSPNENYARELLELYAIGRGLEGNVPQSEFDGDYFYYTEEDVQAGARVLSGFNVDTSFSTIDEETGLPRGVIRGGDSASSHEEGVKNFSSRLDSASVTPNTELIGEDRVFDEISQFVDIIYERDETARHICRELYRFFVYHQIDETLQDDIIEDMAQVFRDNEFKIQPVITALLTSEHFYEADAGPSDNNFGGLIKAPIDLVLGFMRNFEIQLPDYETDLDNYYEQAGDLLGAISNQGMDYYEPFEVAGYAAYHQFPIFNRSWITTNYLTNRYNFIRGRISSEQMVNMGEVDIVQFVQDNFSTEAPNARDLIIAISEYLLPTAENLSFDTPDVGELTVERLNYFLTAFLYSPQLDPDPEGAWNNRWTNGIDMDTVRNQLSGLFNGMLQSPEYQLM
ncbi:MAG: DUF1800 family protein, partial [Bacteroidota bacterium]